MTSIVNNALVWIQLVFVVAFILFVLRWLGTGHGEATFFDIDAFVNRPEFASVGWATIFAGASILAISFLGFDAVTTLAEETLQPERSIGKAIVIICIAAGAVFVFESYIYQLAWPTGWKEFIDVDSAAFELVDKVAGSTMSYIFSAAYVVGCLGTALASLTSASRILFGMGRDGVLPARIFAHVHKRFKTPDYNILILAAISIVSIWIDLATIISLINFGALTGFIMVNISVVAFYFVKKRKRGAKAVFVYLILPLVGAAVCFAVWLSLDVHSKTLGFIWLAAGVIYLAATTNFFRKKAASLDLSEE
jgi:amino acid transporter